MISLNGFSDAFTKREQANEDFFVRQKEMEKLAFPQAESLLCPANPPLPGSRR